MYKSTDLSRAEYERLNGLYQTYERARKALCGKSNCVTPEQAERLPYSPTNEERSSIEVYEFRHNPPTRYFAYVTADCRHVTTWTGEMLGTITSSNQWTSNMGDTRVSIRVSAINGKRYAGTFYKSAGDYCRLQMVK